MKLLVLIPAHNEARSLPVVVDELRRCWPEIEILVVDDASRDSTADVLARLPVRCLQLSQRLGVGGAMRAGLRYGLLLGHETVVRVDGDGQHRANQIQRLLDRLQASGADAVQGSRYRGTVSYASQGVRRLGQRLLGLLLSLVVRQRVTDPTSGFWAFGPRAVRLLAEHHPTGYPEPELRVLLHVSGLKTVEEPVEMRERLAGASSLTVLRAAVALARMLMALAVVPLRSRAGAGSRD